MDSYIIMAVEDTGSFYISVHSMDDGSDDYEDAFVCDHPDYFKTALEFYEEPDFTLIRIPVPNMKQITTELINL